MSTMEVPLAGSSAPGIEASPVAAAPPGGPRLQRNPQLPQHPLGAYTDAQYEAQSAALKSDIAKKYQNILQQLGYIDPHTGQFIQGSVETEANRQKGLLNRQLGLAREDTTHQHQQNNTLFSGLRGTDQARAEFPYTDQLGQIETQTPLTLSSLYEGAGGLMSDYTNQDNQYLADAASRRAAGLAQPGADGTAGTGTANADATTDITVPTGTDPGVITPPATDPSAADAGAAFTPPASLGVRDEAFGTPPPLPNQGTGPYIGTAPVAPPPLPVATTTPSPLPLGDTSGVSTAAKRKLMQWGG